MTGDPTPIRTTIAEASLEAVSAPPRRVLSPDSPTGPRADRPLSREAALRAGGAPRPAPPASEVLKPLVARAGRRASSVVRPFRLVSLSTCQRGWTLIEILVVMSLVVLLAGLALANYRNAVTRSQEAVLKENLFRMRDAIDQYYADKGEYPESLQALVSDGYLRRIPDDPFTGSPDTWVTIQAEPDPSNPNVFPGVYDVHSGSDALALDGTPYADW